jgi:thioredoxin 1
MIEIDDKNFETEILKSDKLALLDFGGQWCQPCKRLEPVLDELANEYSERVVIGHCDVAKGPQTALRFKVMSLPTVIFFKAGNELERFVGLMPRDKIVQKIDGLLG